MDLQAARAIVKTLANGIHPTTGQAFSQTSPYNDPEVIRALFVVCQFVRRASREPETVEEKQQANVDLGRPKNYGLRWSAEDREKVASKFKTGSSIADIASELERSQGSIHGELVRQGLVEPPEDGRWSGAASAAYSKRST